MQNPHCSVQYEVRYGTRSGSSCVNTCARSSSRLSDGVDRRAVPEHVQRRVGGVDDPLAARPVDPGAAELPLARRHPVEDRRAGRRLDELERHLAGEHAQRLADAVARQAARDREELAHEREQLLAEGLGRRDGIPVDRHRSGGSPGR